MEYAHWFGLKIVVLPNIQVGSTAANGLRSTAAAVQCNLHFVLITAMFSTTKKILRPGLPRCLSSIKKPMLVGSYEHSVRSYKKTANNLFMFLSRISSAFHSYCQLDEYFSQEIDSFANQ